MSPLTSIIFYSPLIVLMLWIVTISLSLVQRNKWFKFPFVLFFIDAFISISIGHLMHVQEFKMYGALYPLGAFVALSMFPLFHTAIFNMTQENGISFKSWRKHFILPFLCLLISSVYIYAFNDSLARTQLVENVLYLGVYKSKNEVFFYWMDKVLRFGFIASSILYFILTEKQIRSHKRRIVHYFGNISDVQISWYIYFRIIFSLTLLSGVLYYAFDRSTAVDNISIPSISWTLLSLFFWFIGYGISQQNRIYSTPKTEQPKKNEPKCKPQAHQELSKTIEDLSARLDIVMTEQKLYQNNDLTIIDVAQAIGTNRTYISNYINTHLGTNFNVYINTLRIEYAKDLLKNGDLKMNDLYYECGFASASSFYRVFSKIVGMTPSEYRKQNYKRSKEHSLT